MRSAALHSGSAFEREIDYSRAVVDGEWVYEPLARWQQVIAFDSAAACETLRTQMLQLANEQISHGTVNPDELQTFSAAVASRRARCVPIAPLHNR
jgi:hypothetical protein